MITHGLVLLLAMAPFLIDTLTRVEFPVHNSGAVLTTGASTGIGRHAAISIAKKGEMSCPWRKARIFIHI